MIIGYKTKKLFNGKKCQKNTQKTQNFQFKNTQRCWNFKRNPFGLEIVLFLNKGSKNIKELYGRSKLKK